MDSTINAIQRFNDKRVLRGETMCNKISFSSKKEANIYIKVSERNKKGRGFSGATTYHCEWCGNWHLTSMSKSESRRLRKQHNAKVKKQNEIELAWQQHKGDNNA